MVNEHSVEIKAPIERVFKEIVLWGESKWWPKDCLMKFVNLRSEIDVGTIYLQKVKLPLGPRWHTKISEIKDLEYVKRDFLNGMFDGYEVVRVVARGEKVVVIYKMNYTVRGRFNRFAWNLIFENLHNRNVANVLSALKRYLEQ